MTISEQVEQRVYDRLEAYDGVELNENTPISGSIASVLSSNEVLADNGEQYSSIQSAVNNSENWVFAGPGTYYENVTIDKDDFTLQGAGYDTLIDGGSAGYGVEIKSDDSVLANISVKTTGGAGTNYHAINITSSGSKLESVVVRDSDNRGIVCDNGSDTIIHNCIVESSDVHAIQTGLRTIVTDCLMKPNVTKDGVNISGDDCIVANCVIDTVGVDGGDGIAIFANDNIVIGNRIINVQGERGIDVNDNNNIIANNRVSDSPVSDINNGGTGTVTDGNLTGSAN